MGLNRGRADMIYISMHIYTWSYSTYLMCCMRRSAVTLKETWLALSLSVHSSRSASHAMSQTNNQILK